MRVLLLYSFFTMKWKQDSKDFQSHRLRMTNSTILRVMLLRTAYWLPADCLPNLDKRQHSITMINSTALLGKGLNGLENNNNFYCRLPVAVRSLKSAVLTRFLYSMYLQSFFLLFYLHKKTNLKTQFQILVNPRKIRRKKEGSYLEMGKIQISKW